MELPLQIDKILREEGLQLGFIRLDSEGYWGMVHKTGDFFMITAALSQAG
jgi:hypothetical protein